MNFAEFSQPPELSDEEFLAELATIRPYTACLLKKGPDFEPPGPDHTTGVTKIIWRHGKRNTALHRAGLLPIVCPVSDDSQLAGLGIFSATAEQVHEIMSEDPAIKAHVLTYELHATRSFAGNTLPTSKPETETHRAKRSLTRDDCRVFEPASRLQQSRLTNDAIRCLAVAAGETLAGQRHGGL